MLNKIQKYNKDNELFSKNDKILLAISGGADSVLLFHLFFNLKLNFALAHCNFNLRNDDSKQDEIFVKNLAENYKIDLYVKSFETKEYAKENKVSIEMAARELRYNFFFEIADKHKFTKIATAHHKDDNVETILINLSRKTGLKGLTGIQNKNEKIIRPLLFATKKEIIEYCNINKIIYRTDKTNFETDFYRNKIRLKIIPEFENINPTFVNNVIETAENLKKLQTFFNIYLSEFEKKCISKKDNITTVKIEEIYNYKPIELFLYEYLKKYGFNSVTVSSICNSLEKQSGKEFLSDEYILVKERKELIITKLKQPEEQLFEIKENNIKISLSENEFLNLTINNLNCEITKLTNFAYLDNEKLDFPLTLRHWRVGDYFYPLGMKSKKKLSDFMKDQKLSKFEKEKVWILESNNQIVWIVNHRIDNRFKITKETKQIQIIEYQINN